MSEQKNKKNDVTLLKVLVVLPFALIYTSALGAAVWAIWNKIFG